MLDPIAQTIERYMDLLSARQRLVATNLANVDTPGYRTQDLDFQMEFRGRTSPGAPFAIPVSGLKVKNDGNNVSLDREARLLAENSLRFTLATSLIRAEIKVVRSAIHEGSPA
jgi:flagellar basal-body rod protein FlgB